MRQGGHLGLGGWGWGASTRQQAGVASTQVHAPLHAAHSLRTHALPPRPPPDALGRGCGACKSVDTHPPSLSRAGSWPRLSWATACLTCAPLRRPRLRWSRWAGDKGRGALSYVSRSGRQKAGRRAAPLRGPRMRWCMLVGSGIGAYGSSHFMGSRGSGSRALQPVTEDHHWNAAGLGAGQAYLPPPPPAINCPHASRARCSHLQAGFELIEAADLALTSDIPWWQVIDQDRLSFDALTSACLSVLPGY